MVREWTAARGPLGTAPRAGDIARQDVGTCHLTERVGDVRHRTEAAGQALSIVVNANRVVLGRLRQPALNADPATLVEAVMEAGPTTIRPDTLLESLLQRMQERSADNIVVTTADGRLVGVLFRSDAEQQLDVRHAGRPASK